jgi:hypothetical protein
MDKTAVRLMRRIAGYALVFAFVSAHVPAGVMAQTARGPVFTHTGETSEHRTGLYAWKALLGRIPGAHSPELDDGGWPDVRLPHRWEGSGTDCWFRRTVVIPKEMAGRSIVLKIAMDGEGELFVNGRSEALFCNRCEHEITSAARGGARYHIAVHGKSHTVSGMLMDATIEAQQFPAPERGGMRCAFPTSGGAIMRSPGIGKQSLFPKRSGPGRWMEKRSRWISGSTTTARCSSTA